MNTAAPKLQVEGLLDEALLEQHVEAGVVNCQQHGELPLYILNYSQRAQFEHIWDDVTCLCRGLIVSEAGDIVARPFRKFFNVNHSGRPETAIEALPTTEPEVTEKLDGSLGILWEYNGHRGIATRGSFRSEQARWATEWYLANLGEARWPEGYTALFEIVWRMNQIVVRYEWDGLVLLSLVNIQTGEELPHSECEVWANKNGCKCVPSYSLNIAEARAHQQSNFEGFVLTWHQPHLKVKVKLDEYCRLHRIVTSFSPVALWEHMRYGWPYEEIKVGMNTEFQQWIEGWERILRKNFTIISAEVEKAWTGRPAELPADPKESRKATAQYFTGYRKGIYAPFLFAKLDGKEYSDAIWKSCRPHGAHPYKQVDE